MRTNKEHTQMMAMALAALTAVCQLAGGRAVYAADTQKTAFQDVRADAYYAEAVNWACEEGITKGVSANAFAPDDTCTRAQIVSFLYAEAGRPAVSGNALEFTDVDNDRYYRDAVEWAVDNGVTEGTSATTFSPNAPCTRAQAVTLLWQMTGARDPLAGRAFSDVPKGAWYEKAVTWAEGLGVTSGVDSNTFAPEKACTRAQIVSFLWRLYGQMSLDQPKVKGASYDLRTGEAVEDGTYYMNEIQDIAFLHFTDNGIVLRAQVIKAVESSDDAVPEPGSPEVMNCYLATNQNTSYASVGGLIEVGEDQYDVEVNSMSRTDYMEMASKLIQEKISTGMDFSIKNGVVTDINFAE